MLGTNFFHTVTIQDANTPATVQFAESASAGVEDDTPRLPQVALQTTGGDTLDVPVFVDVSTTDITATGDDYTLGTTTLTFDPGSGNGTIRLVSIAPDTDLLVEADEDFTIDLTIGAGPATLGTNASHAFTVLDADVAEVAFVAPSSAAVEDDVDRELAVVLNMTDGTALQTTGGDTLDVPVFVDVSTTDITATGDDYTHPVGGRQSRHRRVDRG
jgi:hypothetical protein